MTNYRNALPQLGDKLFLLDGGLETYLIYVEGRELPLFAAFDLLSIDVGESVLRNYFQPYIDLAVLSKRGLILDSPTWRANRDWGARLGYSIAELEQLNRKSIALLETLRQQQTANSPIVVSGCIGPRGDGYIPGAAMSVSEAYDYHGEQISTFADTSADQVSAFTLNYVNEAVGIALAAKDANIPVVISFTTETDGCLPDGTSLKDAVVAVDDASSGTPAYYMINCAHPDHFAPALANEPWAQRIRGLRANASRLSHQELEASTELDAGNPAELGELYRSLRQRFNNINVLGGCCGTDIRHISAINACCVH